MTAPARAMWSGVMAGNAWDALAATATVSETLAAAGLAVIAAVALLAIVFEIFWRREHDDG